MFGDHHDHPKHDRPIRYFKLHNSGGAVIHFLVKDKANGRTVWEGGPTLAAGGEATVDLSTTPNVEDKTCFCFGAFVTAGKNATDNHPLETDFSSELVGVWKWTGSTIAGSKVHFEGYEKYQPQDSVMDMLKMVGMVKERMEMMGEEEGRDMQIVCRYATQAMNQVVVGWDLKMTSGGRAML